MSGEERKGEERKKERQIFYRLLAFQISRSMHSLVRPTIRAWLNQNRSQNAFWPSFVLHALLFCVSTSAWPYGKSCHLFSDVSSCYFISSIKA